MQLGLLGEKLSYSLSKQIHSKLYKLLGVNYNYENYEKQLYEVESFINSKKFDGINVTIPYKNTVISMLNYIDDQAEKLQSVNTIVNDNGILKGYNTDIIGFDLMIKKNGVDFKGLDIVIMGCGASAMMIKYYALQKKCKSVKLVGIDEGDLSYSDDLNGDVLINTTPVGMKHQSDECLVDIETVKRFKIIIDINYNPYRTKLLRYGIYCNKTVISGLYMLVAQAIKSEELFLDLKIDSNIIDIIFNDLQKTNNISLIGMMGCGKSTIGKILAEKLNMNFIDLDEYVMEKEGKTIDELFDRGEEFFRIIESKYIKEVGELTNTVIACGGGIIKECKNLDSLYQNGTVIYIDRDIEDIISTISFENRPLIKNDVENSLKILYKEREMLYTKYSEYTIKNNCIENSVNTIISLVR